MATIQERTYLNCINFSAQQWFHQRHWGHAIKCSPQARDFQSHRTQRCLYTASSKTVFGAATVLLGLPQLGARRRTAERTMDDGVSFQGKTHTEFVQFKLKTDYPYPQFIPANSYPQKSAASFFGPTKLNPARKLSFFQTPIPNSILSIQLHELLPNLHSAVRMGC